ncbi:SRPBCC domain-containing protein [Streptomyces sp. bgisy031]|uniref:SRPBCC domain-containing protein n=1 Tax=Streptomyces sp. bgisy031 TaxID=3413772 RepID=UPI003D75A190
MTTQNAINWPETYLPGTGDKVVSNEVIVQGMTAAQVWHYLVDTSSCESYYDNVSGISFSHGGGHELKADTLFSFGTFGFPPLTPTSSSSRTPLRTCPDACRGPRSRTARPRSSRTCRTHGWWRTCQVVGFGS